MSIKKTFLFVHRWLGLITGIIVVILGITGCLFVFHQEISGWIHPDRYYVEEIPGRSRPLPLHQLQKIVADTLGVEYLNYGLTTYKNPHRNWSAMIYKGGVDSWTYFGSMEVYKTAYINPYTGQIAEVVNEKEDFFQIVKGIHWSLLLATPIGQPILAWSTVIFILLLVTGMVLWWPRKWNRAGRRKSFTIRWDASWRRLNYDLHNVFGFYFLILTFIIAFTGLYWYFPSAKKAIHFVATGEFKLPETTAKKIAVSTPDSSGSPVTLKKVYQTAWLEYPEAFSIALVMPTTESGPIRADVRFDGQTYYGFSMLYFDQYDGTLLGSSRYEDKTAGEKLLAMNYDIHVGAIGGLPGKILAFIISLFSTSLPITGFILWWDREKRKKRKKNRDKTRKTAEVLPA